MIDIIHGDCLEALQPSPLLKGATLVYCDPPFFSQRDYHFNSSGELAFSDKWESRAEYLDWLVPRIGRAWGMTTQLTGSLVLHLDTKVAAHVRIALEPSLGVPVSEVIWRYRRWPAKTRNFQRVHDVMLRWARPEATWNQLYEPLSASTVKTWGDRKQRAVVGECGRRTRSSVGEELSPGVPMGDVWDIGIIAPVAKERTGYPTQKPEALLERWIAACTDPGDLVLDPFMGSGTTLAVAKRMGRRAVGIDSGEAAVATAKRRLEGAR